MQQLVLKKYGYFCLSCYNCYLCVKNITHVTISNLRLRGPLKMFVDREKEKLINERMILGINK